MKTISIPTNNRPEYLRRVLQSIRVQPESKDYTLVFSCEPGCREVLDLITSIDWVPVDISINRVRRGTDLNAYLAIATAFGLGSDFNIYLEDDYVLSPDALCMADSFRLQNRDVTDMMVAFRRRTQDLALPDTLRLTGLADGLINTGFACNRWTFPTISLYWFRYQDQPEGHRGWDWAMERYLAEGGHRVWRPMVNRSQHIGVTGTNCYEGIFGDSNLSGPCYAGRVESFKFEE